MEATGDVLLTVYRSKGHTYAVVYRDDQRREVFAAMGRWVGDSRLPFVWLDAVKMGWQVTQALKGAGDG